MRPKVLKVWLFFLLSTCLQFFSVACYSLRDRLRSSVRYRSPTIRGDFRQHSAEFSWVFPVSFVFVTYFCLTEFRHFAPYLVEFVVGLSMSSTFSPFYVWRRPQSGCFRGLGKLVANVGRFLHAGPPVRRPVFRSPRGCPGNFPRARDGAVCFVSGRCHGAAFGGNTLGRPSVPYTITVVPWHPASGVDTARYGRPSGHRLPVVSSPEMAAR